MERNGYLASDLRNRGSSQECTLILAVAPAAFSQSELVRWDIISVAFATPPAGNTISPGGVAFAKTVDGLKIKLTGLGTSQRGFGVSGNSLDLAKYAW